jgi:ubiquinone/menaquinone biosynthesis C-methylase UbiE
MTIGRRKKGKDLNVKEKEEIVRKGYDRIAERYQTIRHTFDNKKELREFASLLPKNATVLDVGCGAGIPVAQFLVECGFDVTGIDFSENMLKLASKNVPKAKFVLKDMTKLDMETDSFDGLTAFYSIIHVPREKHFSLFQSFHRILKPEGIMLICLGPDEWEATGDYYGTEMFWSQHSPRKSLQLLKKAGFKIISENVLVRGGERHYWILARNRK